MIDDEVDEALRALVADTPDMDTRAFAAGRARLLAAIGTPPLTEPAPAGDPKVLVLAPARQRRAPPLRKAAPWLAVAAAVAVVAVGAVALLPGTGGQPSGGTPAGSPTSSQPPAFDQPTPSSGRPGEPLPAMPAQPLNRAGDLAAKATDITVSPGKVRYVRSDRKQYADSSGPDGSEVDELWIPADRDGEWLSQRRASGNIQGRPDKDFEEQRAPGGRFPGERPRSWAELPRDPAALYEKLRAEVNAPLPEHTGTTMSAAQSAVHEVISMLGDPAGAPADLRAALLRTLGYLPGVTVTAGATATDGRPSVILAWVVAAGSSRNELLLDPETARVVEWRNIALKDLQGLQKEQTITSDLRSEAVVSQLGQRP